MNGGVIGRRNVPGVDGTGGVWTMQEIANARRLGLWARYDDAVAADSPIARWRLDETTGTTANDSIGTNHGTISGATLDQPPLINAGRSMLFSGSASGIVVPDAANLSFISTAFSLECWVKKTAAVQSCLIEKGQAGSTYPEYWLYMLANGTVRCEVRSSNANTPSAIATTAVAINDGVRHQVNAVFTPSATLKIYIDGVERASVSHALASSFNSTDPLYLGRRFNLDYLPGWFDEPALYASALSAARIAAHYNAGIGGFP